MKKYLCIPAVWPVRTDSVSCHMKRNRLFSLRERSRNRRSLFPPLSPPVRPSTSIILIFGYRPLSRFFSLHPGLAPDSSEAHLCQGIIFEGYFSFWLQGETQRQQVTFSRVQERSIRKRGGREDLCFFFLRVVHGSTLRGNSWAISAFFILCVESKGGGWVRQLADISAAASAPIFSAVASSSSSAAQREHRKELLRPRKEKKRTFVPTLRHADYFAFLRLSAGYVF